MFLISLFFSSRRRHTRWPRDWSSDVCSSDLTLLYKVVGSGTEDLIAYNENEKLDVLGPGGNGFVIDDLEEKDRKSTRLNSSHVAISYAVFCLKKKKEVMKRGRNYRSNCTKQE